MADMHMQFKIGSAFSGEGFKQAQGAIGTMNSGIRSATGTASQLGSVLGGLDSSAAKAMGAVTGLMGAFMSLNATTILTQAAMLAISKYIDSCNKEMERLKKRSDELKASVDKAFSSQLAASVAEVHAEIQNISGDFDRMTRQAASFQAAMSGLKGSVAAGGIIDLEVEKLNAVLAAHTDAEKNQIEAEYNLRIATEKAAASREQWNDKVAAAQAALAANAQRVALYDSELAAVQAKRAELEENRAGFLGVDNSKAKSIADEIAKLSAKEAEIIASQNSLRQESKTLEAREQQAKQDAINAEKQAAMAVTQASAKVNDLKTATETHAAQEREAAAKQEEETRAKEAEKLARKEHAAAIEQEKKLVEDAKDAQQALNDAKKASADAERAYTEKLKEYNANYAQNKIDQAIFTADTGKGKLVSPVAISKEVVADIVKKERDEKFAGGGFKSVKEMQQFERSRTKELNQQIRREEAQTMREKQRYEQLKGRSEKSLSKQDREFVKDFEEMQAREAQKRADIDAAKQEAERAKEAENQRAAELIKAQEEAAKYTKEIKEKLDRLGLK